MKEVLAIIRPERWGPTKTRLQRLRLSACTQSRVLGRGKGRGLRREPGPGTSADIRYLPKRMISWIVEDQHVDALIQAILEVNQHGQLGDGKIFVLPLDDAVRIRTGERGGDALRAQPFEPVRGTSADAPVNAAPGLPKALLCQVAG
ncbi:MAG: P-II family nitrogen regulator [Candidatus Omnitrophica bacterium]|nr:P-II family nitrogen regulator [Candidatus Omnitrophota bacterium]